MKIVNTLQHHLAQGDVTPAQYVRSCQIALAQSISGCHKIYLDTRYWILFRDVILGRRTDKPLVDLLDHIRSGVRSNLAICPISKDSFVEIFVQNDPATLATTIKLVDELSRGICLAEYFTRLNTELYHFMVQKAKGVDAVHDLEQLVWTKCGYVLGYVAPKSDQRPFEYSNAIEKAFFDQMWAATFSDILDYLGNRPDWKIDPTSVDQMNVGKFANDDGFNSFKQLFMIELAGTLDVLQESLAEIMDSMYLRAFGDNADPDGCPDSSTGKMAANVIYHAFRSNKLKDELPTLRTYVTLHAALRWDRKRKYKPNDLADIRHAAMALPYCDTFLTEGPLCSLLHEKHLELTDSFPCRSFSDPDLALKYLRESGV